MILGEDSSSPKVLAVRNLYLGEAPRYHLT